jgi:hypothetical protein
MSEGQSAYTTHGAHARVEQSVNNKASILFDHLLSRGVTDPRVFSRMSKEEINRFVQEAWEWGKANGKSVPKTKWSDVSDDTLGVLKKRMAEEHAKRQTQ